MKDARGDEFDDMVAAGRTLSQIQARIINGAAARQPEIDTSASAVLPVPVIDAAEAKAQTRSPNEYYAHRKAQLKKTKEA